MGHSIGPDGKPLNRNSRSRPTARNIELCERERRALMLRKQGCTFDEIAEQLGLSNRSRARQVIIRAMDRLVREPVEELRELEAQRLDELQQVWWLPAMSGNEKATQIVLQIMDQRRRLFRLDGPAQVELTTDTAALAAAEKAAREAAAFLAGDVVQGEVVEGGHGDGPGPAQGV